MKGLEKLTSIRLAEVLTQKGVVDPETITDALYIQDKYGEAFVEIMVNAGHIAEWDLARVVVENFQLPFILAGNYQISDEARARVPEEEMFPHLIVPMDLFGDILTVSMPVLTTSETLMSIEKNHKVEIFPYVGLISENKKVLNDDFPAFKEWYKKFQRDREKKASEVKKREDARSKKRTSGDDDWTNLFDSADQAVRSSIKKPD